MAGAAAAGDHRTGKGQAAQSRRRSGGVRKVDAVSSMGPRAGGHAAVLPGVHSELVGAELHVSA